MQRAAAILIPILTALPLLAETTARYLVATRGTTSSSRVQSLMATTSPERAVRVMPHIGAYAANLSETEAEALRASGDVIVEPIIERTIQEWTPSGAMPPFAPAASETAETIPWGVTRVRATDVWPVTTGENVNVAVLDTGIDGEHPELAGAYAGGYNTLDPTKPAADGHRHGTHVAGTIAASRNGSGLVGVAPGVRLWAVKVLSDEGRGTNESVAAGLDWVVAQKKATGQPWVVNLSVGSNKPSQVERIAVATAISSGVVVVAAAGNRAIDQLRYPGAYDDVIAVGATDFHDKRAKFSSYGVGLSIMAPGDNVESTMIKGQGDTADVVFGTRIGPADRVTGSPYGTFTGKVVLCGIGEPHEFPPDVKGQIAFIRRGKLVFREKVRNAKEAGAAAVILQRYATDGVPATSWTLYPEEPDPYWTNYPFPLTVRMEYADGEVLLNSGAPVATVTHRRSLYGTMSGTSMATPHVAGIAALLLSLDPDIPVAQVDYLLRATARDIYDRGWDYETSWGVADALKAAQWTAPERFGVPPPDQPGVPRRRAVGR